MKPFDELTEKEITKLIIEHNKTLSSAITDMNHTRMAIDMLEKRLLKLNGHKPCEYCGGRHDMEDCEIFKTDEGENS